jgi:cytochrome c553
MSKESRIKLFFSLLAVITGGFSWLGSSVGADSSSQVVLPPLKASSLLPTADRPNAPSLARVEGDRKVTPENWEDPAICGGCHTVQYQGWKGSMHSNSFKDPLFQAEWALAEKELGGNIGNLCGGCHSPVGMLTKSIKFDPALGKHGGFTASPIAENGVFCDVCHTISGSTYDKSSVMEHGNGSYQSSPGPIKRGPLKDAKSPYHETAYSEQHTQAAFCGNCHNIFNPLNQFPLERTYDEWKYSVYAQNGVQCQDCHMVPVETAMRVADTLTPAAQLKEHGLGGKAGIGAEKDREIVHGHGFVGGNAVITAVLGDPDSRRHAGIAVKRLRSAADLDISLDSVPGQNGLHRVAVKVTNSRAGHDLPTSLTFIRELWVDVTVTDQNGRVLLRSGALDSHQEVDPNATMFKNYGVDKKGNPAQYIWTVERFERRNTIPPKGHHISQYYFNISKDVKQLRVRAKLNYRSASQHFVDHLLGEGKVQAPVISMNDVESAHSLPDMKVVSLTDHNKLSDSDKEIARLLEVYHAPEAALRKTGQLVQACAACHGQNGIGSNKLVPNLAGQNEVYLLSALRAYKSGTRSDPRMNAMLKDVGDDQLSELAAHYSKMRKEK